MSSTDLQTQVVLDRLPHVGIVGVFSVQVAQTSVEECRTCPSRDCSPSRLHHEMGARSDRVDVFRIDYEGSVAVVTFGGVMVERLKESDGEKIFTHVHQLRAKQEQSPFNREAFFKQLKVAYANCRRSESSGDDFIPVRELHREVILERARRSDTFRRNPEPGHPTDMPAPKLCRSRLNCTVCFSG